MPNAVLHGFDPPWTSSDPAVLSCEPGALSASGRRGMRLRAAAGAAGATVTFSPSAPLDLAAFDELRYWSRTDRPAAQPFLLELAFTDAADAPGDSHRWLAPAGPVGAWEQHRLGMAGDRRSAVTGFSLRCLADGPFTVDLDELLAVTEQPLLDAESALIALLSEPIELPGVTGVPLQPAAAGASTVTVAANRRFRVGNHVDVHTGAVTTRHAVTGVTHATATTALALDPPLAAAVTSADTVSVVVPVLTEAAATTGPALLLVLTDQREEPERGWNIAQRDSFRERGGHTVCSVRPAARPILLEYQILAVAADREQSLLLRQAVLQRVGVEVGLGVNGAVLPVRTLIPPPLSGRDTTVLAPIFLHIGTRLELGERREVPWVRSAAVNAGQLPRASATEDDEGIVLQL